MAKIFPASDLHLEFHRDGGLSFVDSLDPSGIELIVLAGDITPADNFVILKQRIGMFVAKYPHVLYVPGNHEYYNSSPTEVGENLDYLEEEFAGHLNVLHSNRRSVVIGGQRYVGGTLWFPQPIPEVERYGVRALNDFTSIDHFRPWVYKENADMVKWLEIYMETADVLVSHHLPTELSIAKQFRNSRLNPFFVTDLSQLLIEVQPKLAIHGHTHSPNDYNLEGTRIVCNPFGYPGQQSNLSFNSRFIVEV